MWRNKEEEETAASTANYTKNYPYPPIQSKPYTVIQYKRLKLIAKKMYFFKNAKTKQTAHIHPPQEKW